MTTPELFTAYWEDRGAELAEALDLQKIVLKEHRDGLSVIVVEELSALDAVSRGPALEALLRGYRERLHRLEHPTRGQT